MNEPLPYKDPPQLMEQTLNLAPTITTREENVADFKQGRHMQRMATAREFASGRPLTNFIREVESSESAIRELLNEARNLGLIEGKNLRGGEGCHTELSQALPSRSAARTFAQMSDSDKQLVREGFTCMEQERDGEAFLKREKAERLLTEAKDRRAATDRAHSNGKTVEEVKQWTKEERQSALIRGALRQMRDSFGTLLSAVETPTDKTDVRDQLQAIADQLAAAGIYPSTKPNDNK